MSKNPDCWVFKIEKTATVSLHPLPEMPENTSMEKNYFMFVCKSFTTKNQKNVAEPINSCVSVVIVKLVIHYVCVFLKYVLKKSRYCFILLHLLKLYSQLKIKKYDLILKHNLREIENFFKITN